MTAFDKIVVGSDATPRSLVPMRYARALAERAKCSLTAAHAYIHPPDHYFMPDMMFGNFRLDDATVREDARQALEDQLKRAGLGDVQAVVVPGPAHEVLVTEANKNSLIVVGHDHRNAAARVFAGSVATRVVRTAPGPVLVVPPGEVPGLPRKILIADDFSEPASAIVPTLSRLNLLPNAEIHVVYVLESAMEPFMHAVESADAELIKRWEAMERGFAQMLAKRYEPVIAEQPGSWKTSVVRGELAAEVVLECARQEGSELVAVAATGKGAVERVFLGSTTEMLLHKAHVPLLVCHQ